jgi:hypothetical protein
MIEDETMHEEDKSKYQGDDNEVGRERKSTGEGAMDTESGREGLNKERGGDRGE